MTGIKHVEIRGLSCDAEAGCGVTVHSGDESVGEIPYVQRAADPALLPWIKAAGWTVVPGRPQRHYCPEHSPAPQTEETT